MNQPTVHSGEINFFFSFFIGATVCTRWEIQCLLYTGLPKLYIGLGLYIIRVFRSCPVLSTLVEGDGCDRWLISTLYKGYKSVCCTRSTTLYSLLYGEYKTVWSTLQGVQNYTNHCILKILYSPVAQCRRAKRLLSHSSGWWGPGQAGTRGEWVPREGQVRTDNFTELHY